jgi:hypothetical protein
MPNANPRPPRRGQALRIRRDAVGALSAGKSPGALRCRRKFLRVFPNGFRDETYLAWERDYKWDAHQRWENVLNRTAYRGLLKDGDFVGIAARAVAIEARTNLVFSFEKMALRDAVKTHTGAQAFAEGLYALLYGSGALDSKFERWCAVVKDLPRKQTRVLTWPIATVFGFIAQPDRHIFLKPKVTRIAAEKYGSIFRYRPRPARGTYADFLEFASVVKTDLADLRPRDMIDIQSFLWVQGSDEYPG